MNSLEFTLPYLAIKYGLKLFSLVPRKLMAFAASYLGRLWFAVDKYHREIAMDNMENALGNELSLSERKRLTRNNFIQLARVFLEIPSLLRLREKNLDDFVKFEGLSNLKKAASKGRGVLCLSAHMGNWELMTMASALKLGFPIHAIVRPLDYAPADKALTEIRSSTGNKIIDKENSSIIIRRLLNDNQLVGILLDQNASWYEGVFVPFFGKTTCTNKGLAMFGMRYGAPVVPAFNFRMKDGRYKIVFEPALPLVKTKDIGNDIIENTALFNKVIEKHVRLAPDNWFWVHRRWRLKDVPEKARHKIPNADELEIEFT